MKKHVKSIFAALQTLWGVGIIIVTLFISPGICEYVVKYQLSHPASAPWPMFSSFFSMLSFFILGGLVIISGWNRTQGIPKIVFKGLIALGTIAIIVLLYFKGNFA